MAALTKEGLGITFADGRIGFDPNKKQALLDALKDHAAEVQKLLEEEYKRHFGCNDTTLSKDADVQKARNLLTTHPKAYDSRPEGQLWVLAGKGLDAVVERYGVLGADGKVAVAPKPPAVDGAKPAPKADPKAEAPKPAASGKGRVYVQPTDPARIDQIKDLQLMNILLQEGGLPSIQGMTLSEVNGLGGKTTGNPMVQVSGKTVSQLWGMTEAEAVGAYVDKIKTDIPTRDAMIAALHKNVTTNPDRVKSYFKSRGFIINEGESLDAAVTRYGQTLGVAPTVETPKPTDLSGARRDDSVVTPPRQNYEGINFQEDWASARVRRDGRWSFTKPRGASERDVDRIIDSAEYRGGRVRYVIKEQTDGIDDKGRHKADKEWAEEHCNDPAALSRGILSFGDAGKLYITLIDPELVASDKEKGREFPGLIRRRVDDYIEGHVGGAREFASTPFRMEGKKLPEITNAFQALSNTPGFDAKTGMLLQGPGYNLRVFDCNGTMVVSVALPGDEATAAAASQTPREIQTEWRKQPSLFKSEERVRELINGSGKFQRIEVPADSSLGKKLEGTSSSAPLTPVYNAKADPAVTPDPAAATLGAGTPGAPAVPPGTVAAQNPPVVQTAAKPQ